MEWMSRFVSVMDVLSRHAQDGMGVTELAEATGLSKATLHRTLQDMIAHRLALQEPRTRRYYPGPTVMVWGSRFVAGRDISRVLAPSCDAIAARLGFYAFLSRYVSDEVYCIYARQPRPEARTYYVHVGQRMPIYASAAAKAILAFQPEAKVQFLMEHAARNVFTDCTHVNVAEIMAELAEVRKARIAWCREEMERGVYAVSVPVAGRSRTVEYSLSLVGSAELWQARDVAEQQLLAALPKLEETLQAAEAYQQSDG